ncbi:hypothetical protein CPC08DRAFT_752601 [Agrocybe pediades]|nr:hypothetical protein CPC08DRAFT_752601 [Agrocybe pediades]
MTINLAIRTSVRDYLTSNLSFLAGYSINNTSGRPARVAVKPISGGGGKIGKGRRESRYCQLHNQIRPSLQRKQAFYSFRLQARFFEYSALLHVPTHFNSGTTSIPVQIPEAIHHDDQAHILIITDLGQNSRTLKQCLVEDAKSLDVQQVGKALGEWLAELHIWGRTEAAAPLRRVLSQNNDLTDGPIRYACSRLLPEDDPLWKAVRAHIDDLRDLDKKGDSNFVVHGDFITGNVMVVPKVSQNGVKTTKLAVIDWEAANCRNFTWNDIGQMCAEMYFPTFFGHAGNLGTEMVSAFLKAYISRRELSEEDAGWLLFGLAYIYLYGLGLLGGETR